MKSILHHIGKASYIFALLTVVEIFSTVIKVFRLGTEISISYLFDDLFVLAGLMLLFNSLKDRHFLSSSSQQIELFVFSNWHFIFLLVFSILSLGMSIVSVITAHTRITDGIFLGSYSFVAGVCSWIKMNLWRIDSYVVERRIRSVIHLLGNLWYLWVLITIYFGGKILFYAVGRSDWNFDVYRERDFGEFFLYAGLAVSFYSLKNHQMPDNSLLTSRTAINIVVAVLLFFALRVVFANIFGSVSLYQSNSLEIFFLIGGVLTYTKDHYEE